MRSGDQVFPCTVRLAQALPQQWRLVATALLLATGLCGTGQADVHSLISINSNGSLIAAGSTAHRAEGDVVHLYEGTTLKYLRSISAPDIGQLQLSADGEILAFRGHSELVFVRTGNGQVINRFKAGVPFTFSEDGRWCLANVNFPYREYQLFSLSTGDVQYPLVLPKDTADVEGFGFSSDGKHFVALREAYLNPEKRSRERKTDIVRYTIADGKPIQTVATTAGGPKHTFGGFLTLSDGYMIEGGKGTYALTDDGAATNLGKFWSFIKSAAPGGAVIVGRPKRLNYENGILFGLATTVADLKAVLDGTRLTFAKIPYNRLKEQECLSKIEGGTRRGTVLYFTNRHGSVFRVSLGGELEAIGAAPKELHVVAAPAEVRASAEIDENALAEVAVGSAGGAFEVANLKEGISRLTGLSDATVKTVGEELAEAQFTIPGWKASPSYVITVVKPGLLYVWKGGKNFRAKSGLDWEERPQAVSGPGLPGARRIRVSANQELRLSGYELSIIAREIKRR